MITENCITGRESGQSFVLAEQIGEGGAGVVYRALDGSNNEYALKKPNRIDPPPNMDPAATLVREAEIQKQFSHPHITPVVLFDVTVSDTNDPFLITPLAQTDLNRLVTEETPIVSEVAQSVSLQVASALDVIHEEGLTHGDIKPHNVLLDQTDSGIIARLTDFGSAVQIGAYETNPVFATELYAAPERSGGVCSPEVDQYAWAAGVVYPSFTGEAPSNPNEYDEVLDIYGYPRTMEAIIGAANMTRIHDVFQEVAARALKGFPSERYPSMADLLDDLNMRLIKLNEFQQKGRKYIS